jgi:DNA replication protein DnaC
MAVKDMQSILGYIKQRGLFQGITRFQYLKYNMEDSLEIVTAIGKSRNPAFVIDDENRFTYENMIRWCHCDTKMQALDPNTKQPIAGNLKKGIYIAGNTGTGKSWCLEVMAAYAMAFGFVITLGETEKRMLYWDNVRADDICEEYAANGTFQKFKTRNIYGIQDLGSEPAESVYMGNRIEVLRQLLEYRGDRTDQVTLITSNLPMNHKILVDRYGDRVSSRLSAMCNYFEIRGKDRRKM